MITLIIPGKPIAKKRPRFVTRDRRGLPLPNVKTINIQETEEGKFLFHVYKQWKKPPIENPIVLILKFLMEIPHSQSKKKINQMISGEIKHTKKPDLDNLIKFTKDCLNGVVWKDDAQVFSLVAEKKYSDRPHTIISIFVREESNVQNISRDK